MEEKAFQKYLAEDSPYRCHKSRRRQFFRKDCCGAPPREDGSEILHDNPDTGAWEWFPLYRCERCGAYYIRLETGWKAIETPLRYSRRQKGGQP